MTGSGEPINRILCTGCLALPFVFAFLFSLFGVGRKPRLDVGAMRNRLGGGRQEEGETPGLTWAQCATGWGEGG